MLPLHHTRFAVVCDFRQGLLGERREHQILLCGGGVVE